MNIMTKEEARKELEFYKNLASNHEALVKGCNERIIELEAIINKPDRWQDGLVQSDKEAYFYLMSYSDKGLVVTGCSGSKRLPEHAFRTKEQAELIKEKMLLMQEMYAFAHVRNEGWMPDWQNEWEEKYGIAMYKTNARVIIKFTHNEFVFGVAVKSMTIAEEMLEIFGERIEKFYNKQY